MFNFFKTGDNSRSIIGQLHDDDLVSNPAFNH